MKDTHENTIDDWAEDDFSQDDDWGNSATQNNLWENATSDSANRESEDVQSDNINSPEQDAALPDDEFKQVVEESLVREEVQQHDRSHEEEKALYNISEVESEVVKQIQEHPSQEQDNFETKKDGCDGNIPLVSQEDFTPHNIKQELSKDEFENFSNQDQHVEHNEIQEKNEETVNTLQTEEILSIFPNSMNNNAENSKIQDELVLQQNVRKMDSILDSTNGSEDESCNLSALEKNATLLERDTCPEESMNSHSTSSDSSININGLASIDIQQVELHSPSKEIAKFTNLESNDQSKLLNESEIVVLSESGTKDLNSDQSNIEDEEENRDSKIEKNVENVNSHIDEFETEEWNELHEQKPSSESVNRKFDDFADDDDFDDADFQSADEVADFSDFDDAAFEEEKPSNHTPKLILDTEFANIVNVILDPNTSSENVTKMFESNLQNLLQIRSLHSTDFHINCSEMPLYDLCKSNESLVKKETLWANPLLEEAFLKQVGYIKQQKLVYRKRLHPTTTHKRTFSGLSNVDTSSVFSPMSVTTSSGTSLGRRQLFKTQTPTETQEEFSDSELEEFNSILARSKNAKPPAIITKSESEDRSSDNEKIDEFDYSYLDQLPLTRSHTKTIEKPSEINLDGLIVRERSLSTSIEVQHLEAQSSLTKNENENSMFEDDFSYDDFGVEFQAPTANHTTADTILSESIKSEESANQQAQTHNVLSDQVKKQEPNSNREDDFDDDFSDTSFGDVEFAEETTNHAIDSCNLGENIPPPTHASQNVLQNDVDDWRFKLESFTTSSNTLAQNDQHKDAIPSEFMDNFDDFINLTGTASDTANKPSSEVDDILNIIPNLDFIQSSEFMKWDANKPSATKTENILDFF